MKGRLDSLLGSVARAAVTPRCAQRLRQHMLAALLCPERATMTNLLCTSGLQQLDWSAHYRLYSRGRADENVLFDQVRQCLEQSLAPNAPLVVAVDDTIVRKTGVHAHGVRWRRDPLGPPFQANLVRAQRYLQFSAAWPLAEGNARMLPIDFQHVPGAGKPARDADAAALAAHKEQCKQRSLNTQTLQRMERLRGACPPQRQMVFVGDGSYTNRSIVRGLPANSTFIGRMRKDAVLHCLPHAKPNGANGRPRSYGQSAPTPEAVRSDETIPWQRVSAFAAGKVHDFRIKTLGPVLWRKAGADKAVRIIVIAPLSYRLRQGARLLYRRPAFLLCTDVDLPLEQLLQYYLWRWGIEVNVREEKTLIGTGQAQVRNPSATQHLPAVTVAAYAMLWAAALQLHRSRLTQHLLQPPKWRVDQRSNAAALPTTGQLIRQLRYEVWATALRPETFSHFVNTSRQSAKRQKPAPSLPSVLFCAA